MTGDPNMVYLVTKKFISDATTHPPLPVLPIGDLSLLDWASLADQHPRLDLGDELRSKYRSMAEAVEKPPWGMRRAADYVRGWIRQNQAETCPATLPALSWLQEAGPARCEVEPEVSLEHPESPPRKKVRISRKTKEPRPKAVPSAEEPPVPPPKAVPSAKESELAEARKAVPCAKKVSKAAPSAKKVPKAVPSAKVPWANRPDPPVKLGCGRCRWGRLGCDKCRAKHNLALHKNAEGKWEWTVTVASEGGADTAAPPAAAPPEAAPAGGADGGGGPRGRGRGGPRGRGGRRGRGAR